MKHLRIRTFLATSVLAGGLLLVPAPANACSHDDAPFCEEINEAVSEVNKGVGTVTGTLEQVKDALQDAKEAVCAVKPEVCNPAG